MFKTGLKTFAYSFVFSLSAIIAVNKAVSRDIPSDDDIKIPHNNISLFLKENTAPLQGTNNQVKKIALIKQKQDIESSSQTLEIASRPLPEIVIQQEPENKDLAKKDIAPKAPEHEQIEFVPIAKKPAEPAIALEKRNKIKSTEPQKIQIAAAEVEREVPKAKETLLIPLQKINSAARSEKIAINSKAAESQVAMLNLEKPIKSVVAETENKKNESSEGANNKAEISGWQSMAEKKGEPIAERAPNDVYKVTQVDIIDTPQEDTNKSQEKKDDTNSAIDATAEPQTAEDNKWVAAKGTKFPVNQNVLEQDYYKQAQDTEKVLCLLRCR